MDSNTARDLIASVARDPRMVAIRENAAKIEGCPKHHFKTDPPPYKLGQRFTCSNCGGEMDGIGVLRYMQGYLAAGGNSDDVCPGWFG